MNTKNKAKIDWKKTSETLYKNFSQLGTDFGNKGWILPWELSPGETEDINDIENIDSFMANYYGENERFSNMVSKLIESDIMRKHRTVLLQTYTAYQSSLYSICIIALTTLFESVLISQIDDKKIINYTTMINSINQIINLKYFPNIAMYNSIRAYFANFSAHINFSTDEDYMNRNSILHGRAEVKNDQITVIRYFSNLYNLVIYFTENEK